MRSSMTRMYAVFISAKSSAFNLGGLIRPLVHFYNSSSRVHRLWTSLSKNRTNFLRIGSCLHGADAEIRVPPVPVAGDDAAADAGDQAAAAVESRPLGLCRGGTGAKSAARARQRRHRAPGRG